MDAYIDITDKEKMNSILNSLLPDTPAVWGTFRAQNMIEHLTEAVQYTNGKKTALLTIPKQEAERQKKIAVHGPFQIPRGAKGFLSDATQTTLNSDLQEAITILKMEIDAFEQYFKTKGTTAMHQAFGPMNYQEWLIWHGKHFTHHFRQFGLLSE
jgi:hypothetical protein